MKKLEILKEIEKISQGAYDAMGQMFLAPGELGKKDMNETRDIGIERLRSAVQGFQWCANRIQILIEKLTI